MATYDGVMIGLVVILCLISFGSAKVYKVGGSAGWALSVDYDTWASDKTFKVGDSLVFNYDSSHTVDLVSKSDYTTCTIGNSISSYNSGPTTISLNTTGSHYFICGIMGHCGGGMKLKIDVTSDGSPSAAPTPSSSIPADSPTTTPLGTTLPPPTFGGSGTSNIPVVDSSSLASSPLLGIFFCLVATMFEFHIFH
ncbi:stellacyanin-like [Bidens hawaiensis]|uniref:stellacyanin-like n=1 Tax=Bidens hawaiensis TaxID=980011 RepID=UPI00404B7E1F